MKTTNKQKWNKMNLRTVRELKGKMLILIRGKKENEKKNEEREKKRL